MNVDDEDHEDAGRGRETRKGLAARFPASQLCDWGGEVSGLEGRATSSVLKRADSNPDDIRVKGAGSHHFNLGITSNSILRTQITEFFDKPNNARKPFVLVIWTHERQQQQLQGRGMGPAAAGRGGGRGRGRGAAAGQFVDPPIGAARAQPRRRDQPRGRRSWWMLTMCRSSLNTMICTWSL